MLPIYKRNIFYLTLFFAPCITARKWRDSGSGSIIFEEAWTIPELLFQIGSVFTFERMVISCAQPCTQGIADPVAAASMAVFTNNQLASQISNNTERFGGFATLSMHNASEAALELQRTVKELGFLGAMLNDYQQSGSDGGIYDFLRLKNQPDTLLYYDQPEYDVFWQMVSDLDVPIYFHPRGNIAELQVPEYAHAPFLKGPAQEFAVTLSTHILGLCTNGVFDRFPKVQVIVGHMGERIPSDLSRIDFQLLRQVALGMPMKANVTSYFHTNIYETTSGNFGIDLLKFHIGQIGLDRIMYSVDYPFVDIPDGTTYLNSLTKVLKKQDLQSLTRELAIKVLHLND
ncbi:amidohydrolase 2 [Crassisporium funariophilum]|nr:amidohydrolase 2 [Crassisporium funariophilum]